MFQSLDYKYKITIIGIHTLLIYPFPNEVLFSAVIVCLSIWLFVSTSTQEVVNRLPWNFMDGSGVKGRTN